MTVTIIQGDCLDVMRGIPDASVHSCVTDPPYHLTANKKGGSGVASVNLDSPYGRSRIGTGNGAGGFMGQAWDGGDVAFRPETWAEVLRVLKPGGHLLAFSGTRTYHRMACAIEDAGFEIRDQIGWVYGSGFPKSHNLGGDWQGWGTALKPAWEPICVARKPITGTVAQNMTAHGTGALNIDGCRVATDDVLTGSGSPPLKYAGQNHRPFHDTAEARGVNQSPLGRWPANLIHDGSDEVVALFPQSGGSGPARTLNRGSREDGWGMGAAPGELRDAGSGSAARFFYCAKASRAERDMGMGDAEEKPLLWSAGTQNPGSFQSEGTKRAAKNNHPTVKPIALMRWLVRLVTPPGGLVLDPFGGSGTTGIAAQAEGFDATLIEMNSEYVEIARRRVAGGIPRPDKPLQSREPQETAGPLFDGVTR